MSAVTQTSLQQPLAPSALASLGSVSRFATLSNSRLDDFRCPAGAEGCAEESSLSRRRGAPHRRVAAWANHISSPVSSFASSRNSFSSSRNLAGARFAGLYLVGADSRPRVAAREPGAARAAGGAHDGARVPNCGATAGSDAQWRSGRCAWRAPRLPAPWRPAAG